ncbi:hypothetical protein [Kitasatospora sp. NPDC018619]|uniref:hypothetical protein n=1 Tax=unclassified Kitasatospora TaxID=2633591 RepID=UPI00378B2E81
MVEVADRGVQRVVVVEDGVVEAQGEGEGGADAGDADLGVEQGNAVEEVLSAGAGVAYEGGDAGGEGGGAQVGAGKELGGEVEVVVGRCGVGEGADEGELRLVGGGPVQLGVHPPQVAQDAVPASGPAEGLGGGQGGGGVAFEAGEGARPRRAAGAGRVVPAATCCMPCREAVPRPRSRWALAR